MANEIRPITPLEAKGQKEQSIHPGIIKAVNALLIENFNSGTITIKQKEIVQRAIQDSEGLTEKEIYSGKHLQIEGLYKKAGWSVKYDKPAYNENYDAFFEFTAKKTSKKRSTFI